MRIGLLGFGTIGSALKELIEAEPGLELAFVFDADQGKLSTLPQELVLQDLDGFELKKPDLIVEAASHQAVKQFAEKVLEKTDLLVLSVGALAEKSLEDKIKAACQKFRTKLFVPSGAIVGLDGIAAVKSQLEEVQLETRKKPQAFDRTDEKETTLFEGSARKACLEFPKNVNVAATLALNGVGFDQTKVKIVSDPSCQANFHLITATGSFGKLSVKVEALPSKNPKTSQLAILSVFSLIKKIQKGLGIFA